MSSLDDFELSLNKSFYSIQSLHPFFLPLSPHSFLFLLSFLSLIEKKKKKIILFYLLFFMRIFF